MGQSRARRACHSRSTGVDCVPLQCSQLTLALSNPLRSGSASICATTDRASARLSWSISSWVLMHETLPIAVAMIKLPKLTFTASMTSSNTSLTLPLVWSVSDSAHARRVFRFDIAKCDIKGRSWWPTDAALRFYRTWSGHGRKRLMEILDPPDLPDPPQKQIGFHVKTAL